MSTKARGFGWLWIVGLLAILILFKAIGVGAQNQAVESVAPSEPAEIVDPFKPAIVDPFKEPSANVISQAELDRVNADMEREQQVRRDARVLADELRR